MSAQDFFLPSMADRISTQSFLITCAHTYTKGSFPLVNNPRGRGAHTESQWLDSINLCPREKGKVIGNTVFHSRNNEKPEQHWHAPPLCTKQPVRGGFERKRLRLKCCKRQC